MRVLGCVHIGKWHLREREAFYADDTVRLAKIIPAAMLPDCLVERKMSGVNAALANHLRFDLVVK